MDGGNSVGLPEHHRVAISALNIVEISHDALRLARQLDSSGLVKTHLRHEVVAITIAHLLANLNRSNVRGFRNDTGRRQSLSSVLVVILDRTAGIGRVNAIRDAVLTRWRSRSLFQGRGHS